MSYDYFDKGKKRSAADQTAAARGAIDSLRATLSAGIETPHADWPDFVDKTNFSTPRPERPSPGRPLPVPPAPDRSEAKYRVSLTGLEPLVPFIALLLPSKRRARQEADERFARDMLAWETEKALIERTNVETAQNREATYQAAVQGWERDRKEFLEKQAAANADLRAQRRAYELGDPSAIELYYRLVLEHSAYPDYFPRRANTNYGPDNRVLYVDYWLPSPGDLPTLVEVRYVKSRDSFAEKHLSEREQGRLYDDVIYQTTLRSLHEVLAADRFGFIEAVVINGRVRSIDRATGREIEPCILSVMVTKERFQSINLAAVDAKTCFRALKGIAGAALAEIAPVAPVAELPRSDPRFIDARHVTVDGRYNLAEMPWEDFEHLIRELFELEFGSLRGSVRITQASRDRGVDAIAFDPDPIRGGKIIIQAKRYTNTVDVAAVRDLYGTLLNEEGAMKGILVTTADYGKDAYEFAAGKPLTLLNGGHLLSMLERHGQRARINLEEARKKMRDSSDTR